jgi:nuclear pore complex protein Nup53
MQQKFLSNLQSPQPIASNSSFIQQPPSLFQAHQANNAPNAANTSISGPPINSLYDNFKNDKSFQTPNKPFTQSMHQSIIHQDTPVQNRSGFNQSRIMSPIPNVMSDFNNSYQNPAYPIAIQPSFNQSMSGVKNNEFWITVFGFNATSTSIVLSHFSGCGTILDKVCSNGNWIHLRFSSRGECEKALLYNGKIIGNNLMIGVIRCQDESVFEKENVNESQQASVTRVRSLTQAAYQSAKHNTEVVPSAEVPQKATNGIVSRAVDLLFGW